MKILPYSIILYFKYIIQGRVFLKTWFAILLSVAVWYSERKYYNWYYRFPKKFRCMIYGSGLLPKCFFQFILLIINLFCTGGMRQMNRPPLINQNLLSLKNYN